MDINSPEAALFPDTPTSTRIRRSTGPPGPRHGAGTTAGHRLSPFSSLADWRMLERARREGVAVVAGRTRVELLPREGLKVVGLRQEAISIDDQERLGEAQNQGAGEA